VLRNIIFGVKGATNDDFCQGTVHASIITLMRPETMHGAEALGGSIVGHFGSTK